MEYQKYNGQNRPVFIVDGLRTPFLKFRGLPGEFSASDLAVAAAKPLLARQNFLPSDLDQVVVGCVNPSENEANIARVISLRLGCGDKVPAFTVQRNCASGLQSIDCAWQAVRDGRSELVLAGGVEVMSRAPLLLQRAMVTWMGRLKMAKTLPDKLKILVQFRPHLLAPVVAILKGLTDPVINMNMGQTAEELAYRFKITRREMDEYAVQSHLRMVAAIDKGELDEITPLYSPSSEVFEFDDGVRADSSLDKLGKLKPAFEKYGSITAGNSSQISDGSAFVILASKEAVEKYNLPVLGKIVDIHWAGLDPAIMGLGPVHAITPILKRQKLGLNELDTVEINEAFAAQVLACVKAWKDDVYCRENLGLDKALGELAMSKLNPEGGAIAIGHPVGASGVRVTLHALKRLHQSGGQRAIASLCIGGGQGGAILVEKATGVS